MTRVVGENVAVVHATLFPRFTRECCQAHMAEDVWLLDRVRCDINKEIVDRLKERQIDTVTLEWWTL